MPPNQLTRIALDAAYKVHSALGPGLLETVYEMVLAFEIAKAGIAVRRQVPIPVHYEGLKFDEGFRADLVVEDVLVIELKAVEALAPVHAKQLLTHLKLSHRPIGLLINFGEVHLKDGIKRIVNDLPE